MLLVEVAEGDGLFLECGAVLVSSLCDLGSSIVTDMGVQGRHEHERLVQKLVNSIAVGSDTSNTVKVEGLAGVAQKSSGVEHVTDDEGLEDVELEVTAHTSNGNSSVVAHDLSADHGHSLTLSGVDLAGHDRGTRLVLGERKLTESATRARSEESNIVGDLHESASETVQSTVEMDKRILGGKSLELVGSGSEVVTSLLGNLSSNLLGEANVGVKTGTDGSATLSDLVDVFKRLNNTLVTVLELMDVAGEFLTKGQRSSILSVSSSNLDDIIEVGSLGIQLFDKSRKLGEETLVDFEDSSDMHDRREGIVG